MVRAKAHIYGAQNSVLSACYLTDKITDWSAFLRNDDVAVRGSIEAAIRTGRPLGSKQFVESLEKVLGRTLQKQKPGRKPKAQRPADQDTLDIGLQV